jgi:hypothetical protein
MAADTPTVIKKRKTDDDVTPDVVATRLEKNRELLARSKSAAAKRTRKPLTLAARTVLSHLHF